MQEIYSKSIVVSISDINRCIQYNFTTNEDERLLCILMIVQELERVHRPHAAIYTSERMSIPILATINDSVQSIPK